MLDILRQRRSIRAYTEAPVDDATLDALKEAVLRAPSSRGLNPWAFVFVTDRTLLKKLATCKPHGAEFLAQAPLGVVIWADPERADTWIEDCSIAAIILQLAAESLGLGSCWVQVRLRQHAAGGSAEDFVRDVVGLPGNVRVLCIIAIGHPERRKRGHARESLPWDKIRHIPAP
ncbi:nitroreductase [Thermodesulfomicrobium sp. WS]|uniref:nitroreductase family protein n=1 Tax=Thermodesulfomicrobium sp. WS TaxID=3004129 RepID=UPI0024929A67|nr:nitroreductase family protein [Thermodesulfomicrobium sp. WS]BDV00684.1 nitroreductase [Thermodesulfomicrobium sp. WS]